MKIILTGNPISTNHLYRYSCAGRFPTMYMTKRGKERKEQYQWEARSQYDGEPLESAISAQIKLYFGTKRKVDIDNFGKILWDSMEGIVFENDNQIQKATVEKFYDKDFPRIEVVIKELK